LVQPPQWSGSLFVLTQLARVVPPTTTLQRFILPPQVVVAATQAPALHSSPAAHCLPQAPQANGLLEVSTQARPPPTVHWVSPGRHAQVPLPLQYWASPHAVAQLPQRLGLSSVSVQVPVPKPHVGMAVVPPGRFGHAHLLEAQEARRGHRL
jgi:hypothetical protein